MPFFGNPSSGGSLSSPPPLWRTQPFGSFTNSYVVLQAPSGAEGADISAVDVSGCFLPSCAKGGGGGWWRGNTKLWGQTYTFCGAQGACPACHQHEPPVPCTSLSPEEAERQPFPPAPTCTVGGRTWGSGSGHMDDRQAAEGRRYAAELPCAWAHTPDAPTAPRTCGHPPRRG